MRYEIIFWKSYTHGIPVYFLLKKYCFRFRQTIAAADSMLSKLEADYQETIQCLQNEKTSLDEQVRMLEQSQGYLKNQLAKAISDTERHDQMADLAERLLATGTNSNFLHDVGKSLKISKNVVNYISIFSF